MNSAGWLKTFQCFKVPIFFPCWIIKKSRQSGSLITQPTSVIKFWDNFGLECMICDSFLPSLKVASSTTFMNLAITLSTTLALNNKQSKLTCITSICGWMWVRIMFTFRLDPKNTLLLTLIAIVWHIMQSTMSSSYTLFKYGWSSNIALGPKEYDPVD